MADDSWNTRHEDGNDEHRSIRRGDLVECLCDSFEDDGIYEGDECVVEQSSPNGIRIDGVWYNNEDLDQFEVVRKREDRKSTSWYQPRPTHQPTATIQGGSSMGLNTVIAGLFDSTADAVLVNKYFGHEIHQSKANEVLFSDKGDELLASAKEQQAKDDAREHIVTARITE